MGGGCEAGGAEDWGWGATVMHCASKAIVRHGCCLREGFSEISAVGKEAEAMGHNETYPRAQQLPIRLHSETAMGRGGGGSLPSISWQFSWENKSEMHKPGINICCVVKTVWFSPSSSPGWGTWPLWASLCCHDRCPPNISSSALMEMDNANKPPSK